MGGCSSRHFGITLMLNLERSSLGTRLLIFILQLEAQKVLKIWEQTFLMKRYTGRFFSMWKKSKMGFSGSVYSSSFFWMSDFHIHLLMRTKSNTSYLLSAWHAREGRWHWRWSLSQRSQGSAAWGFRRHFSFLQSFNASVNLKIFFFFFEEAILGF